MSVHQSPRSYGLFAGFSVFVMLMSSGFAHTVTQAVCTLLSYGMVSVHAKLKNILFMPSAVSDRK